jgi:glycosyltransferase involved in cell wall biosynthesis
MAVESALVQTLPPTEVIIVDDGSDPEIAGKMAERWDDHPTVSLHTLPEKGGVSHARNVGKELSTSDYLLFLDDDDLLLPDMLEKCMEEIGEADIVSCRTRIISDDGQLSKSKIKSYRWGYSKKAEVYRLDNEPINHLLLHAPSIHSFVGKSSLLKSVDFDVDLKYGEDLDYWVRLANGGASFHKVEFEGAVYRMHRKNASGFALYKQKEGYYMKQIDHRNSNPTGRGIARFKFGLMSLFQLRLRGLVLLLPAVAKPVDFIRHSLFFVRFWLAGYRS